MLNRDEITTKEQYDVLSTQDKLYFLEKWITLDNVSSFGHSYSESAEGVITINPVYEEGLLKEAGLL